MKDGGRQGAFRLLVICKLILVHINMQGSRSRIIKPRMLLPGLNEIESSAGQPHAHNIANKVCMQLNIDPRQ